MNSIKFALLLIVMGLSVNSFACKPASALAGSTWIVGGVLNKLVDLNKYKDYSVKEIAEDSKNASYKVILSNGPKDCVELNMRSTSNGMCKFSANVLSVKAVDCN